MKKLLLQMQTSERLCVDLLLDCLRAIDEGDWPGVRKLLEESQRRLEAQFDAERTAIYPRLLSLRMAPTGACVALADQQTRAGALLTRSLQLAFQQDTAGCRKAIADLRNAIMVHWMEERQYIAALSHAGEDGGSHRPMGAIRPGLALPQAG